MAAFFFLVACKIIMYLKLNSVLYSMKDSVRPSESYARRVLGNLFMYFS